MIELIVLIAIMSILMSLLLPAVQQARSAAHRTQCQNNLRNIAIGMTNFDGARGRLPASGVFDEFNGTGTWFYSWSVSLLPWVGEETLANQWDFTKPNSEPINLPLTLSHIPVYVCPRDITVSPGRQGDQSYAVNGGVGYTTVLKQVGDCPVDLNGNPLDLNGNDIVCPSDPKADGRPSDRMLFKQMGLFFLENLNPTGTIRHYTLGDVTDGRSQTFLVTENVRTGYDPADSTASFASSNANLCAIYIGDPCPAGVCNPGNIDYSRCNSGSARINSGLTRAEETSPVPNSFHDGGVNMAYADGHVKFLSVSINGGVYAAMASPVGGRLQGSPLQQVIISGNDY